MFGPQVAVKVMVKKAAEIDSTQSLDLIKALSLSGWELTSALSGYVSSAGRGGNWRQVIEDLSGFEQRRDSRGNPVDLSRDTRTMIAGQWVVEDFEKGMQWFTKETERDYSNPKDVSEVSSVLARLPEEERHRAVEWLQNEKGQPNWDDSLILKYGASLVRETPDANANQLVGMMSRENDRYELVKYFIGSDDPHQRNTLPHSPEDLNRLIESANLSSVNAFRLKEVVSGGYWHGR